MAKSTKLLVKMLTAERVWLKKRIAALEAARDDMNNEINVVLQQMAGYKQCIAQVRRELGTSAPMATRFKRVLALVGEGKEE